MLTDDIGVFTERGGTILFYLSKKGIAVVDSQFPDQSKHLIDELKKKSEKPFKLLINTHHHGDHSGGNISFKGLVEHVIAHENSKINQEKTAKQNKNEDKQLYPDQTYTNTWCQKLGKEKFVYTISVRAIQTGIVLSISSMPILCIAATWSSTAVILS